MLGESATDEKKRSFDALKLSLLLKKGNSKADLQI